MLYCSSEREPLKLPNKSLLKVCVLIPVVKFNFSREISWQQKYMFCANWYHLHNLKNVKNTQGGLLLLVKLLVAFCSNLKQEY